jgi:hypothetical protein
MNRQSSNSCLKAPLFRQLPMSDHDQPMSTDALRPGDRFRLSPLGIARCAKFGAHTGVVVGYAGTSAVYRVRLDGTRNDRSIHRSYIMLEPEQEQQPSKTRK